MDNVESHLASNEFKKLQGQKLFLGNQVGCVSSRINVQKYEDFLVKQGAQVTPTISEADIVLIDTCAFSEYWEKESVKSIQEYQSKSPTQAKVIVSGCLPVMDLTKLKNIYQGPYFTPKNETQLARILDIDPEEDKFLAPKAPRGRFMNPDEYSDSSFRIGLLCKVLRFFHRIENYFMLGRLPLIGPLLNATQYINEKAFAVNISQGCMGDCSFCVIPMAKGRTQSMPIGSIIDLVREKVTVEKVNKIILSSEDTGAYGVDIGASIVDLLKHLHLMKEKFYLYILFFDPRWLKLYGEDLIPILKQGRVRYLQFPLQSGSNKVLSRMRRSYKIEDVMPIIRKIHKEVPNLTLQTQIISGFPGESEEDHQATKKILKEKNFNHAWIFEFSNRKGARTETMEGHLPIEVIRRRARELRMASGDYLEISKHR